LTEHTGGKWPFWISPRQVIILNVSEQYADYAEQGIVNLKNKTNTNINKNTKININKNTKIIINTKKKIMINTNP